MQLYTLQLPEGALAEIEKLGMVVSGPEAFDQAHVLIADISKPSLNVGFEIGRAQMVMKPVLCLKNKNTSSSEGGLLEEDPDLTIKIYEDEKEIPSIVKDFLSASEKQAKTMNDFCCGGGCCH